MQILYFLYQLTYLTYNVIEPTEKDVKNMHFSGKGRQSLHI